MTNKKSDARHGTPSRLSLASRMLGGAVRPIVTAAEPDEPWRHKKSTGKNKSKKRK